MNLLPRLLSPESATFLVNVMCHSTAVLVFALLAERLFRRHLMARHAILLAGLVAAVGVPAMLAAQQKLGVALITVPIHLSAASAPEIGSSPVARPVDEFAEAGSSHLASHEPGDSPNVKSGGVPSEATPSPTGKAIQAGRTPEGVDNPKSGAGWSLEARQIAVAGLFLWILGSAILSWRLLTAWFALGADRRRSRIAQDPRVESAIALLRETWHGRVPEVRVSARVAAPLSAGVLRPFVFLPESSLDLLTTRQLRDVLLHEAAHIERRDHAVLWLQRLATIGLWPNPLVHRLNWLLDAAREDICDNYVIAAGDAVEYTRTLLKLSQHVSSERAARLATCLLVPRRRLETRIRDLLAEGRNKMTSLRPALALAIGAGCLAFVVAIVAVRAQDRSNSPKPTVADASTQLPVRTGPMRGRVIDDKGQPLKNVKVRLHEAHHDEFVDTDATGHFVVPESWSNKPLQYSIIVRLENGAIGWYGSGWGRRSDQPPPQQFDVTVCPLSETVRGKLVEKGGKPAAGVRLKVISLGSKLRGYAEDRSLSGPALMGEAVTNDRGEYSLQVPDQTYCQVRVVNPRYTAQRLTTTASVDAKSPGDAMLREVGFAPRTDLEPGVIELTLAGWIEGRVVDGHTGRPLANASVGCQALARDVGAGGWGEAASGADGRYRIDGLTPGIYNVVYLAGSDTHHIAIANDGVLVEAGKAAGADLVVTSARRLAGRVVNADTDEPMPGLPIGYHGAAAPQSGAMSLSVTTDVKGEFEFHVPPGPSRVFVQSSEYPGPVREANATVPETQEAAPILLRLSMSPERGGISKAVEVSIARPVGGAPQPRPIPAARAESVSGVVRDPSGKPIAGARIFHTGDGPDEYITSDAQGKFVFQPIGPARGKRLRRGTRFTMCVFQKGFHVWGGTPRIGDVLIVVLEPKVTTPGSSQ